MENEVTFTDWDSECDLLIEYLNFKVEHSHKNQLRVLSGTCILVQPRLTAKEFFDLYMDMGFMISDTTPESDFQALTFEIWKKNFNKN